MQYRDKRNAGIWWSLSAPLLALESLVLPAISLSNSSTVCPMHALDESSWRVWVSRDPARPSFCSCRDPKEGRHDDDQTLAKATTKSEFLTADLWRHVKPPLRNPSPKQ